MTAIRLDRLTVNYGATRALGDFTMAIDEAELVALLGPSGCGKTTVLKVVAGLLAPASGDVRFDGVSVLPVPAERRGAAMVFQKPLLFPHMTVAENVGFGLKMRRLKKDEIADRVAQALRLVKLEGYERRKPHELSGGQEQRVTLARALVTEPRALLLDEPFSALDENLRGEMRTLVRELQQRLRITTIFVTHDQR
ncbi:MAG TPA: ABC transporter ATP-binding protein, partial [Blastocatellia bacterium]